MTVGVVAAMAVVAVSCGGRRHDVAYFEQMVDSIRKVETVEDMQRNSVAVDDDVNANRWFDTLQLRTLPIRNAGDNLALLGDFAEVPKTANGCFGHTADADLRAMALPRSRHNDVFIVAEMNDSAMEVLSLCTMDRQRRLLNQLCIYQRKEQYRQNDFGQTFMEYYVTSNYEITVVTYYQSHHKDWNSELLHSRHYVIDGDGRFKAVSLDD